MLYPSNAALLTSQNSGSLYLSCVTLLGEKLSKQQLQHSNIIKKLRVKEKDSDARIVKQQKKAKEQEEELRHLQQVWKRLSFILQTNRRISKY